MRMKNTSKILIALGAGMVIGGVLGVLVAPAKGTDTRQRISDNSKKLAEKFKGLKDGKLKFKKDLQFANGEMEEA